MRTFIQRSACHGKFPKDVSSFCFTRERLLRELTAHRGEIRLIMAPGGYGKSSLCAAYASVIFNFKKTFWIDGSSSCFLRDLDAKTLLRDILTHEQQPNLCIFDNVCYLDARRKTAFKKLVGSLKDRKVEVIINTATEADNDFDDEFFQIGAKELLLSDADRLAAREEVSFIDNENTKSPNNGVMCLCFRPEDPSKIFSQLQTFGERIEVLIVMFCLYILQTGSFDDIYDILGKKRVSFMMKKIGKKYPHFGIDVENEKFKTTELLAKEIRTGMHFCYKEISCYFTKKTFGDLSDEIAKKLIEMKKYRRATEFVFTFYDKDPRLEWFISNNKKLLDSHNSAYLQYAFGGVQSANSLLRDQTRCLKALIEYNNNNNPGLIDSYYSVINSHFSNCAQSLFATMLYSRIAKDDERFLSLLKMTDYYTNWETGKFAEEICPNFFFTRKDIRYLYRAIIDFEEDKIAALTNIVEETKGAPKAKKDSVKVSKNALYLSIAWIFEDLSCVCDIESTLEEVMSTFFLNKTQAKAGERLIKRLAIFLEKEAKTYQIEREENYYFGSAMRACVGFIEGFAKEWDSLLNAYARQLSVKLANLSNEDSNRARHKNLFVEEELKGSVDAFDPVVKVKQRSSMAEFSFFGTCGLKVGGRLVDSNLMHRKNTVLFLFYLCLNLGREVSREELISFIWDGREGKEATMRRSFYQVTSAIGNGLNKPFHQEFLKRNTAGFYLDEAYCKSDLQTFNQLCMDLTFNMSAEAPWEDIYIPIIGSMSKPLVMSVRKHKRIDEYRHGYQNRLADALIGAGDAMMAGKEARAALWFAREAKYLSPNREDVYLLIMRAQNFLCQRTEAISTYFECKDYMQKELGMMPARSIQSLYKEIIQG